MDRNTGGGGSFEDRLETARRKQGLLPVEGPKKSGPLDKSLGIGLRVGVELVSTLVVAVAIGWWLDGWLHTRPFLLILFVLLGGAAGIANIWRLVKPRE